MSVLLNFSDGQGNRRRRCYLCDGHFGLIRHRFAQKQFCSKTCLEKYKTDTDHKLSRIKKWTEFLGQKQ